MEITIYNPENPEQFYVISRCSSSETWIGTEEGEGAAFSNLSLYQALSKFYKDNF